MRFLLLLLSTATSLVRVHGRPQDLSKLPPDEAAVTTTREFLTRGADGASLSETGDPTEPPSIVTDSAVPDSAAAETTETYDESTDSEQTPSGEEGQPTDAPSGDASADDGESSSGAASSENSPAGGLEEEEGGAEAEVTAQESSTIAPVPVTPPSEPAVTETEAPEPAEAEAEAPEPAVAETEAPEPAEAETEAPEPAEAEAEAPEPAEIETEAPEPAVTETEAPEPAVAETEAPEPAVAETEAPELAVAETEAPEPAHTAEPAPADAAAVTEAPQETEQPEMGPGPTAEEVPATEPASAAEEPATEAAPASEEPVTEVAATTPKRSSTEAASATEPPQAAEPTTVAAENEPEGTTTPGPELAPTPVSSGGAEQGEAAAEVLDSAAQEAPGGAASSGVGAEKQKLEKLEVTESPAKDFSPAASAPDFSPPADEDTGAGDAAADGTAGEDEEMGDDETDDAETDGAETDDSPPSSAKADDAASAADDAGTADAPGAAVADGGGAPADLVDLDDIYSQGVTSQIGQSSVLTDTVHRTMLAVFLQPREVAYRLGRHTVNTIVTNLTVTGIENMHVLEIASNMDDMALNITFQFPEITFSGDFNATGSILGRRQPGVMMLRTPFPSYGSGQIRAIITNTTAVSRAELSHSFNDRKLAIELLTSHLSFAEPEVRLTELRLPRALQKLYFERLFTVALGKMISHQLATEIEPKVDESLHDVITSVLDRVSLDEAGAIDFARLEASPDAWRV